jgi:hypothetical protein
MLVLVIVVASLLVNWSPGAILVIVAIAVVVGDRLAPRVFDFLDQSQDR